MPDAPEITVIIADDSQPPKETGSRIRQTQGPVLLVLPPSGLPLPEGQRTTWFRELLALNRDRVLIVATKHAATVRTAKREGWQIIKKLKHLRAALQEDTSLPDAVRVFSPGIWRQQIRSRLQFLGILSLPKFRIWILLGTSVTVFLFVFLRLLPSAEVRIWPTTETDDFTTNVYLASSGATLPTHTEQMHILTLYPLTVNAERTITIDQISKNFTGKNAEMTVTITNNFEDDYSFRKGTRLTNQAGITFRTLDDVRLLPSKQKVDVRAVADPLDLYGEVVGERGNVPVGVEWTLPGLPEKERAFIKGRNAEPGRGGTTSYSNIVKKEDIDLAKKKLEQELLAVAKQMVADEVEERAGENQALVPLRYDELTKLSYHDFNLSESFVGQSVGTFPVSGAVSYTIYMYDQNMLMKLLKEKVGAEVNAEMAIDQKSLSADNLNIYVIPPWDDDLRWIKITADLNFTQRYILDPLTPAGARFAKLIRDSIAGKSVEDAIRVIRNFQQVAKTEVKVWPPWTRTLPDLGSSIAVSVQEQ